MIGSRTPSDMRNWHVAKRMQNHLPLPYAMKKKLIAPVVDAMVETMVEEGVLHIKKLGKFYLHRRRNPRKGRVTAPDGTVTQRSYWILSIRFRPSDSLKKRMRTAWEQKVSVELLPPETSPQESASSADGTESAELSVLRGDAPEGTSTIKT